MLMISVMFVFWHCFNDFFPYVTLITTNILAKQKYSKSHLNVGRTLLYPALGVLQIPSKWRLNYSLWKEYIPEKKLPLLQRYLV